MRVTHVITRLIIGGAQENTIASVLGLQRKPGITVRLVSGPTTGPEGSLEGRLALTPEVLSIVPCLVRPVHPWLDWRAFRALTRVFRVQAPNIVHTHSGKAGFLGRLAARRAGVPVIVHTVHGPSFGPFQGPLANWVFRSAERCAGRFTNHFVTVAQAMTEQYLAAGIGRPEQYTRIFSGFDLEPLVSARNDPAFRARLGIAPEDFVVGKIARLFKLKGHEDLLVAAPELVRRLPSVKFLLVGDGVWRQRLEDWARRLGLSNRFVFAGLVPPEEVPLYIGIMDVLIHLSRREGLARSLPQALAAGKPVVAWDCDGAREVCRDGETGFLLAPGDLGALTDRVVRLARDSGLRQRLGQRGRELVSASFSLERMVESLHTLYLRLLNELKKQPVDDAS
jgi:glycosyltransferase involved in cell wall biosynthesis